MGLEKSRDGARGEAGVKSCRAFSRVKKFGLPTEDDGALPGFKQRGEAPSYMRCREPWQRRSGAWASSMEAVPAVRVTDDNAQTTTVTGQTVQSRGV